MAIKYIYIIEGQTDAKLVKHLSSTSRIPSGKRKIFNLWEQNVRNLLRTFSRKDNHIYIVFDTDVLENIGRFNKNIKQLSLDKSVKTITLLQQTNNLEDELVRCCNCQMRALFDSFAAEGVSQFKRKFLKVTNLNAKLSDLGFNYENLWSQDLKPIILWPDNKKEEWRW